MIAALSRFFELELQSGRLQTGDPEVLARMLMGSLHHFCMAEVVAEGPVGRLDASEYAAQIVEVLLRAAGLGDAPRRAARRASERKKDESE